jgi:nucleoside-triphosphatase THEP1
MEVRRDPEGPVQTRTVPPPVLLLTGRIGEGKTTFVSGLVRELKRRSVAVKGFLSRGEDREGIRVGYLLENIETGERWPLASVHPAGGWTPFRRFFFNPATFEQGRSWLAGQEPGVAPLVVIDEVGPLELEGGGWFSLLEELNGAHTILSQLWVAREQVVQMLRDQWNIPEQAVFHMLEWVPETLVPVIIEKLNLYEKQK